MKHLRTVLLLVGSLFSLCLFGQQNPLKWGKVDAEDLALTQYPADTSVAAWVLGDNIATEFYFTRDELKLRTDRHRRVKLFKRSAFDEADITVRYYSPTQAINNLQALLHLPNGETLKFKTRDFERQEEADSWYSYKLSLPQITEGAIFEYSYELTDDEHFQLPSWSFQEAYPVRYSEYRADVPEWFDYVSLAQTGDIYTINERKRETERIMLPGTGESINAQVEKIRMVAENLPPIEYQPYTNNLRDYLPRVRLQLRSVQWPRRPREPVIDTWANLAEELRNHTNFGSQYRSKANYGRILRELEPLLAKGATPTERALIAYQAIGQRMNWDGNYRIFTTQNLSKSWEQAEGNSAELNLMLLAVLRDLDIPAYPVLISTRDHGGALELYPLISQFNHVLVLVKLGEQFTFFDVGSMYRPAGLPRIAALNRRGWLVDEELQQWVDITTPGAEQIVMGQMKLDATGVCEGTLRSKLSGYYAVQGREWLHDAKESNEGPLVEKIRERYPEAEYLERSVEGQQAVGEPLNISLQCRIPLGMAVDDYLYLNPVLIPVLERTLVETERRLYPVDMPYTWSERYIFSVTLPEGYEVAELPQTIRAASEDGSMRFTYGVNQMADQLTLTMTTEMKRSLFAAEEYETLREFFALVIERQDAQIVLRKTAK